MSSRRDKGGGGGHGGGGEERWLLPYADMITLLLGLFIVLFAMSSINAKQFDNLKRSLAMTFSGEVFEEPGQVLDGSDGVLDPDAPAVTTDSLVNSLEHAANVSGARQAQQAKQLEDVARSAKLGNDVKVNVNERGIVVTLAGDALFDSGSSQLRPQVRKELQRLERQLVAIGRPIEVAGHTDGQPFPGPDGNWGLSSDRATAVVRFFIELGFPQSLLVGRFFADTRPAVAPPKGNPKASVAANRRIEITVLAPGADDPRSASDKIGALTDRSAPRSPVEAQVQGEVDAGIVSDLVDVSKEFQ